MQATTQTRSFSFTNLLLLTLGTTIIVATVTPDAHAASLWKKLKIKLRVVITAVKNVKKL